MSVLPTRRKGLECHLMDGEAILYDLAHHAVHYLNSTAYEIWRNCDGSTMIEQLFAKLTADFDNSEDNHATVEADLHGALQNLVEHGLVDCVGI